MNHVLSKSLAMLRRGNFDKARIIWKDLLMTNKDIGMSEKSWWGSVSQLHKIVGGPLEVKVTWVENCQNNNCGSIIPKTRLFNHHAAFQGCNTIEKMLKERIELIELPDLQDCCPKNGAEVVIIDENKSGDEVRKEGVCKVLRIVSMVH